MASALAHELPVLPSSSLRGQRRGGWKEGLISALVGMVFAMAVLFPVASPARAQSSDPACIHGMRIVGEKAIYLSHMGLFNIPCHQYQGLFEVSFEGPGNPEQIYRNAQKADGRRNEFTFEPTRRMVLPKFVAGEEGTLIGRIHSGQYERSETSPRVLASGVTVKLKRVLFFRPFQPGAKQPDRSQYLLFGSETEQLAAHRITAPPDFDQVVALTTPLPLTTTELEKAIPLLLPNRPTPNAKANANQALKPGDKPAVRVDGRPDINELVVGQQYFFETRDYQK